MGSMMPYHPIDHDLGMRSVLSRYTHFWCFVDLMHLLILSVLISQCLLAHLSTKIPFRGNVPRRGMPPCRMQVPLPDTHLRPLSTPLLWPLQAMRAVHSCLHYHPREQRPSVSTAAQIPPARIIVITFVYIHMFYVLSGVLLDPSLLHGPQVQ